MSKTAMLPEGKVSYLDRGEGDPLLFVHGLLVNGQLWKGVADRLEGSFRCIVPDWPMGSHRTALNPGADLSPPGIAGLIAAFMDALELDRVTLVGNDTGGAMSQIFTAAHPDRVERLILTNCDTLEHFPPFPFNGIPVLARLPGGITVAVAPFRIGAIGRLTYGTLTARPLDPELVRSWLEPVIHDRHVRRDTRKLTAGIHKPHDRGGREPALVRAPGSVHLGHRGPLLQASSRRAARGHAGGCRDRDRRRRRHLLATGPTGGGSGADRRVRRGGRRGPGGA